MISEILSAHYVGKMKWMECVKYGIVCFVLALVVISVLSVIVGSNIGLPSIAITFIIAYWVARDVFDKKSRDALMIAVAVLFIDLAIVGLLIMLFGVALFAAFMT